MGSASTWAWPFIRATAAPSKGLLAIADCNMYRAKQSQQSYCIDPGPLAPGRQP